MTLKFIGGPIDGYLKDCPLNPPPVFFLPTKLGRTASVYLFDSIEPGVLRYIFEGYKKLSETEELELFANN